MDLINLEVLQIHKHSEYLKQCCDLINEEWPRSETARMTSLRASRDSLPTSLILVTKTKQVIGHCKLTAIPSKPDSCFMESVVISKDLRGRKLGTFLMTKAEEYCKNILHLKAVYLATKGQEIFYSKLGYKVCAPVSIYGGNVMPFNFHHNSTVNKDVISTKNTNKKIPDSGQSAAPPPPPPPMPTINLQINNNYKINKIYMFKYL